MDIFKIKPGTTEIGFVVGCVLVLTGIFVGIYGICTTGKDLIQVGALATVFVTAGMTGIGITNGQGTKQLSQTNPAPIDTQGIIK